MIDLIRAEIEVGSDGDVTDYGVNFSSPNNGISSNRMDHVIDELGVRISADRVILITHKGRVIRLGRYEEVYDHDVENCDECIYFGILRCIPDVHISALGCYGFPCCVDDKKDKIYKTSGIDHISLFTISKYKSQKDILIIDINQV